MYFPGVGWPIRRDVLAFAQDSATPLKDLGGRHDLDATDLKGVGVARHGVSIHVPSRSPCEYNCVTVCDIHLTGPSQLRDLGSRGLGLLLLTEEVKLLSPLVDCCLSKIYGPLAHSVLLIGFSGFLLCSATTFPAARPRDSEISLQTGVFYRAVVVPRDPARSARSLIFPCRIRRWVEGDAQGHRLRITGQRVGEALRTTPSVAIQVSRRS